MPSASAARRRDRVSGVTRPVSISARFTFWGPVIQSRRQLCPAPLIFVAVGIGLWITVLRLRRLGTFRAYPRHVRRSWGQVEGEVPGHVGIASHDPRILGRLTQRKDRVAISDHCANGCKSGSEPPTTERPH